MSSLGPCYTFWLLRQMTFRPWLILSHYCLSLCPYFISMYIGMRRSRNFCQGIQARPPENSSDNVYLVLNLFYRGFGNPANTVSVHHQTSLWIVKYILLVSGCWHSFICLLGIDLRISLQLNETNTDIMFNSSSDELTNDIPWVSSIDITLPPG